MQAAFFCPSMVFSRLKSFFPSVPENVPGRPRSRTVRPRQVVQALVVSKRCVGILTNSSMRLLFELSLAGSSLSQQTSGFSSKR